MGTTSTALAAAFVVVLAAPAAAADFCTTLKAVVEDTPKGYAAIRGPADPKYPASYWSPLALPDAVPLIAGGSPCYVLHAAKTNPPDEYRCYFPGAATREGILADMHRFADRVSDCVGPMAFDPKLGLWSVARDGVQVIVGGVLAPANLGNAAVLIIVEPEPPKKR